MIRLVIQIAKTDHFSARQITGMINNDFKIQIGSRSMHQLISGVVKMKYFKMINAHKMRP